MNFFNITSMVFLVLGGLNWGLVTCFEFNLVEYIFGEHWIQHVIYILTGLSGIYAALNWKQLITSKNMVKS